jgi:hypothetical protein
MQFVSGITGVWIITRMSTFFFRFLTLDEHNKVLLLIVYFTDTYLINTCDGKYLLTDITMMT